MATFKERVVGLTGLTISASSDPTEDQLTEFLKDGVIDVSNRWIAIKPQDREDFQRESAEITSQAGIDINGAHIISVVRESGTDNDWRSCRRISPSMQGRVVDSDSLHYASAFNPAYMVGDNSKISVFPTPGSNPNAYKVYYVNNSPVDKGGSSLIHSHSDIGYFGDDKVYLVVIFASMKALQGAMAGLHSSSAIDSAFTSFRSNISDSISKFDLGKTAVDRIDSSLYNTFSYDNVRGRFKDVKDSLDKANNFIDGGLPATGYDAVSYFLREDPEIVQSSLQMAAQELNNATASLGEMSGITDLASKEAQAYIGVGGSLISAAQQYLAEVQAQSAEITKQYSWYDSRYRQLKAEYDQAFGIAAPRQEEQQRAR